MSWEERFRLDGKVAVVTGASYGLGVIFATALADAGADIAICARTREGLERTAAQIEALGRRVYLEQADVRVWEQVNQFMQNTIAELGRLDILVNNAGVADTRGLRSEHAEPDCMDEILRVNLVGVWHCCRAAAPHMLRHGSGSIINISSILGTAPAENRSLGYVAAKGAVNNLTRSLAVEWADRNVRVNALAPNYFMSELTRNLLVQSGLKAWVEQRTPQRRLGEEADLIGPIIFLASDASSYVTGQILHVDGGWVAGGGTHQLIPHIADAWDQAGGGSQSRQRRGHKNHLHGLDRR
jgi:NAD(P)-dependent dehydrogenase (short-subunit alcohol dehydrogenase family)